MSTRRGAAVDVACCLALALVSLLAHWRLVSGEMILADYDAFVYFYPNREYTAARLLSGELPLWNPYTFGGAPHLANPQSAVFYPGTWLFLLLSTPLAYSINLVVHVALAGVAMYLLVRRGFQAPPWSGAVAGLCYMLSGPIVAQGGHLNQLSAAALLPLVVLAQDKAVCTSSRGWIVAGGALLALQVLAGHPQVVYMTLAAGGLLLLWRLAGSAPGTWVRQMAGIGAVALLGLALAAIQLLPLLEVTRRGIRAGGLSLGEAAASSLPPELLPLALLPGYIENPASTEFLGFIGATGLTLALIGAVSGLTRRDGWVLVTAILGLLLALGSSTPVFETLFGTVPGFSSFRVPARWLLVWTFSVSLLAGLSLRSSQRPSTRWIALSLIAVIAGFAGLIGPNAGPAAPRSYPIPPAAVIAWLALAVIVFALWLTRGLGRSGSVLTTLVAGLIVGELMVARLDLPFSHVVPRLAWMPTLPQSEQLRRLDPGYRVLSIAGDGFEPDQAATLRERYPDLPAASFTQLLTALKWWDVQAPNLPSAQRIASMDGYDGGVLPLSRYVLVASLLHPLGEVRPDGVLISSLDVMPRAAALDLFGVGLVVASSDRDANIDGLSIDRAAPLELAPGALAELAELPNWPAAELAILASAHGEAAPVGQSVGEIELQLIDGESVRLPLRFGIELASSDSPTAADGMARLVAPWRESAGLPADGFSRHALPGRQIARIVVRNVTSSATLRVSGITFLSADEGVSQPLLLDASLDRTTYADTRVYERRGALPRAYLTHAVEVLDDDSAIAAMAGPDWSPRDRTILATSPGQELEPLRGSESVTILSNGPERVALRTETSSNALLVLSDPWYPGWYAMLDGQGVPMHRANIHFRAIEIPAGLHDVQFVYDAAMLKAGAVVSAAAVVLATAGWLFGRRSRRSLP